MGVIVALFLTTVWELPDSHASRTKRQVTPFLYIATLIPYPLGAGSLGIFALKSAFPVQKEAQNT